MWQAIHDPYRSSFCERALGVGSNGAKAYVPAAALLCHQVEPDSCCEDSRWEARLPDRQKRANGPICPVTGKRIPGIPHLRPAEYRTGRLHRHRKTVNRAYGGNLCGSAVRERIIRAFLVEEQKIVKKVLKIQKSKEKQAAKAQS